MKTAIRRAILGAALAALPLAAAAQTMAPTIDAPVTIRFYNYNLASAGLGREGTLEMIAAFEAANPMIKVEGVGVPWQELIGRVQADVVAGQGPDIAQIIFSDFAFVVENFGVPALEDIVPPAELADHFAGFLPNGLELGRLDGQTYGLAYVFSTPVLYYNADVFRAAGLDPDQPPKTWEEVREAARAITEATGNPGFVTGLNQTWLMQAVIMSNGGRVISEDRKTLMFGEPEAVEAISMLRAIASDGSKPNLGASNTEVFSSGKIGMYLITSAVQGALLRASAGNWELRAAPMPGFGDRKPVPVNSGSALLVMTDDPVKQRAAWELMKHLTSDYGYTVITSKIGYVPLRPNAIESEEWLAGWLRDNPIAGPNIVQLDTLSPWVAFPGANYRQIGSAFMNAIEAAVFAPNDPAETLADAQRRAQALMPR